VSGPGSGPEGPDSAGADPGRDVDRPAAAGPREEPAPGEALDEVPLRDPAHRTARWVMVLAPLVLVVVVFLLLRLSTG
jgi:hypothetical protein